MAAWTFRIDSLQLNDMTNFLVVEAPQVDDLPPGDNILVEMAGDWPDFVRWQPQSGLLTLNLFACQPNPLGGSNPVGCTEDQWATRIAALHAALTPGLHTIAAQARGWTAEKYVLGGYRSMATNYRLREISLELFVPKPVWTPV